MGKLLCMYFFSIWTWCIIVYSSGRAGQSWTKKNTTNKTFLYNLRTLLVISVRSYQWISYSVQWLSTRWHNFNVELLILVRTYPCQNGTKNSPDNKLVPPGLRVGRAFHLFAENSAPFEEKALTSRSTECFESGINTQLSGWLVCCRYKTASATGHIAIIISFEVALII